MAYKTRSTTISNANTMTMATHGFIMIGATITVAWHIVWTNNQYACIHTTKCVLPNTPQHISWQPQMPCMYRTFNICCVLAWMKPYEAFFSCSTEPIRCMLIVQRLTMYGNTWIYAIHSQMTGVHHVSWCCESRGICVDVRCKYENMLLIAQKCDASANAQDVVFFFTKTRIRM